MNSSETTTYTADHTEETSQSTSSSFQLEPTATSTSTNGKSYWKCLLDKLFELTKVLSGLNNLFGGECVSDSGRCSISN